MKGYIQTNAYLKFPSISYNNLNTLFVTFTLVSSIFFKNTSLLETWKKRSQLKDGYPW